MYTAVIDFAPLLRRKREFADLDENVLSFYGAITEIDGDVNAPPTNNRGTYVFSQAVVPGMRNPIGVDESNQKRATFFLSPHAASRSSGDNHRRFGLISQTLYESSAEHAQLFDAHLASDLSAAAVGNCGWLIEVYARVKWNMVYGLGDVSAPAEVQRGNRDQRKTSELKIAETVLWATDLLQLTAPTVLKLNFNENGSGTAAIWGSAPLNVKIVPPAAKTTEEEAETERAAEFKKMRASVDAKFREDLDKYRKLCDKMENLYLGAFPSFADTEKLSDKELDREARTKKFSWYPIAPGTSRYHIPWWKTYARDPEEGPIDLPIWMFSVSRSNNSRYTQPATAFNIEFMSLCLQSTLRLYRLTNGDVERITRGTVRSLAEYMDRLCFGEVCAHFLTLPAFMKKYRSDYGFEVRTGKAYPSESVDTSCVTGESDSGDCEDLELVVREMYILLRRIAFYTRIEPTVDGVSPEYTLSLMAKYICTHFEYLDMSGSTTASFPGADFKRTADKIDQSRLFYTAMRSGYKNNADTEMNLLRQMRYNCEEDRAAQPGFHQYAMLIPPARLLDALSGGNNENTVYRRYLERRVKESLDADTGFPLDPILLEGTYPVSTCMVSPSVRVLEHLLNSRQSAWKNNNGGKLPITDPTVLSWIRADNRAASDATLLKGAQKGFGECGARVKDLLSLRQMGAHVLAGATAVYSFDIDYGRRATTFYRDALLFVNTTFLLTETTPVRLAETKLTYTEVGAMSYGIWHANEDSNRFGVPLEDLYRSTELKFSMPFAQRCPSELLRAIDSKLHKCRFEHHHAPVNFGCTVENTFLQSSSFSPSKEESVSVAHRILNTRIVVVDAHVADSDEVRRVKQHLIETLGIDAGSVETHTLRLYSVFGDSTTFVTALRQ